VVSGAEAVRALTAPVTIVVPVWNQAALLQRLLDTIAQQTQAPQEVIVVDNGSADDAPEIARRWGARVVPMGRNAGFAAAVNRGISESSTDWIALINSDVELPPDWLATLLRAALETDAWFATGKIFMASDPSLLDGAWDLAARSGCAWRAGHGRPDSAPYSARRPIHMASATATLYRRDLFARVGTFEEAYESYLEDVDFSLRSAAAGFAGTYEPAAVCTHHGGASTGVWSERFTYLASRNQSLLVRRLFPRELRRSGRWNIAAGQLLWGLVALRHGRMRAWLRGKSDARRPMALCPLEAQSLQHLLSKMEHEIYVLQRDYGMDLYWRMYFFLTGGESGKPGGESK
jgi:GT2 family glycosyltransferase